MMKIPKETVVIVDEDDKVIGFESKKKVHRVDGILHRGFAVLIFNRQKQLLIQKRSKNKKLWPKFWDASCCSHPFPEETYEAAGKRRVKEELGIDCEVEILGKFEYDATYKNIGSENEICAVLVGRCDDEIDSDPEEISDWEFINLDELKDDLEDNPEKYTPWFRITLKRLKTKAL